jgi:uncharacterized protein (DUF2267 family)
MAETMLPTFEHTLSLTNEWLEEVGTALETDDQHRAYQALRATLHALRDRVTPEEAAQLGAQLPLLLRGAYYEGWHPAHKPLKERHREQFLDHIRDEVTSGDAETTARAVFGVLAKRVSDGEIEDLVQMLPEGVRELWPDRDAPGS